MITEYALTPQLFDNEHNTDNPNWLEHLRGFANFLLPVNPEKAFNTVISDLYDASWFKSAFLPLIDSLEKRQSRCDERLPALDLLKTLRPRIERHLVPRPAVNEVYPSEEEEWCQEAVALNKQAMFPIHRIVGSNKLKNCGQWYRLDDTDSVDFCTTIPDRQWVEAKVTSQIECVKRLSQLYSFIGIASPFMSVDRSGKDLNYAIALIKYALDRHPRHPLEQVDLHTEGPYQSEEKRKNYAMAIFDRLRQEVGEASKNIRLYLWPSLLERHLLFGKTSSGQKPKVVWVVSATHFARPNIDGPDQDPSTFTLLPAAISSKVCSRYYTMTPNRKPYEGAPYSHEILDSQGT